MNSKKLLTIVVGLFVIVSLFIVYSKYNDKKLVIEAEKNELTRLQQEIKKHVELNDGELKIEKLDELTELYKLNIEDIYQLSLDSDIFIKEETASQLSQELKFVDGEGKVRLKVEVSYFTLPKMAILIDDVGMTTSIIDKFDEIDRPLNFAILPYLSKSKETNEILKSKGYTTMLHMPMEGSNKALNENTKGLVYAWMKDSRIIKNLDDALANIGKVDGFNNHMGSAFTSTESKMRTVLNYARENNLYYVDSNTSRKNKGYGISKEIGVKTTLCRHFLDNSKDIEDIKKEIKRAIQITKANEQALFIGHYHKNMAIALKESIDLIEAEGIKLVYVNEILE